MYPDQGCHGHVKLGPLPPDTQERLKRVPGVWLEYDAETSRVVVRHAQPTSGPALPVITGELVQLLSEIPAAQHSSIPGGDFYIHTTDTRQFVRLQVSRGGVLELRWANPAYERAEAKPYAGRGETKHDPPVHRLNGAVGFEAKDPASAVATLERLADTFEGLYPEGYRHGHVNEHGRVEFAMRDLNLDAHLLIEALQSVAETGTLEGDFLVDCFGDPVPEDNVRIVLREGAVLAQHPVLWHDTAAG